MTQPKLNPEYKERIEKYKLILFGVVSISNMLDVRLETIIHYTKIALKIVSDEEKNELRGSFKDKIGIAKNILLEYDDSLASKFQKVNGKLSSFNKFRNIVVHGTLTGNYKHKNPDIVLVLRSTKVFENIHEKKFHRNYFRYTDMQILPYLAKGEQSRVVLEEIISTLEKRIV